jgi:hypothetical protein
MTQLNAYRFAYLALAAALGLFMAALPASPLHAAVVRVDDTGTVVNPAVAQMRWKQLVPGRGADQSVETSLRVALRLDLTRWVNQPVRMYMAMAPGTGDAITATWRTQGRLLPGSVRSGSRTLVFDGIASGPKLEETIDMVLRADGRTLNSQQSLQFYFEVDTP